MLRSSEDKPRSFKLILVVLVWMSCGGQSLAQVVSVKCCITEGNLIRIGECLSGPGDPTVPTACGSIGTCVLGFGQDTTLMGKLCDPDQPEILEERRAVCKSWVTPGASVIQECPASPNTDFNLFETFDADLDGDLDLSDIAAFQQNYQSVPNEVQSDARLVFVECCTPTVGMSDAEEEVLDSDVVVSKVVVGSLPTCTLGFSGILEPGDYLYRLCGSSAPVSPVTGESSCVSWSVGYVPVVYLCEAADAWDYRCPTPSGADLQSEGGANTRENAIGVPPQKRTQGGRHCGE